MTQPLNYVDKLDLSNAKKLQKKIHESVFGKPNKMTVAHRSETRKAK